MPCLLTPVHQCQVAAARNHLDNLVNVELQGNRHLYSIKRDGLEELRDYLDNFWSNALTAYSAEIARRVEKERD